jgi:hypothetical protein
VICSRVSELQETLSAGTIALEISSRNARVQAMQDRWSMLRAGIAQLMIERAADTAEAPGGGTGLPVRHYQGGALAKPVYKVDTGLVTLIAQLLAHEKQAAEELGQWTEKREYSSRVGIDVVKAELRVTQHRMAEEKREALAKGLPWPPK